MAIWRLLGWLSSGLLDGVPANILEPYEKLNELIILDTKFDMVSTVKKAAEASGTYKKT